MLVKIAILFLAAMLAVALIGNLLMPGRFQQRGRRGRILGSASGPGAKCPKCGRPKIGKGACPCGKA